MFIKTQPVSEELGDGRSPQEQIKSLKTGKMPKSIVGYDRGGKTYRKMKGLPRMFLKTNEIQN
jgi:hypothetical protein